jgi:IBR domain, a half RING-finger domain
VRISRLAEVAAAGANIKVESPSFAKEFCAKLKSDKLLATRYPSLEAFPVAPYTPSGSTSRRVSCKKVHISWHKPSHLVWLNFGKGEIARRVSDKFNKGTYRILGQTINADPPKHSPSGRRNPVAWTVVLKDVPYNATLHDIENSIRLEHDKPRHVESTKLGNTSEPDITILVESLFTNVGPVKFEMNTQWQGKRFKAVARFEEEADAREAVRSLDNKRQDFLNEGKLTVQLVCSAKFKVSTTIYDALGENISTQSAKWMECHLQFKVYRNSGPLQRYTTLKIEGEQVKEVADATSTLEKILDGQTIMDGVAPVWSTVFTSNGAAYQKLKQTQQQHGVVIIRSKAKKQLKFFGPPNKYQLVQRTLIELVRTESAAVHIIHLDSHEFSWACNGGFKQIATALGGHIASFDIVSNPKRVVITGSQKQYQTALGIIRGQKDEVKPADFANTDQDCTICWNEAENPLLTSCSHHYCLQCFEDLCMSAVSGEKDPSIYCQGEMGKCGKVFGLHEIQDHLSSAAFEGILEASFASYIRRHPQHFRYCPTPDCGYVYRPSITASQHTCTKCLEVICVACHERHGAMTCAEYRDLNLGGYEAFRKYKKEKGIKDCPKCTTPIEKVEGCNHMTCRGCGSHICWVCLMMFTESGPCYAHMNSAHGGIGLGLPIV